ncbi:unnamed protein product [Rhizoctonia solani]|uniref:Uncharacterized protein n=1 Tax=Rhizoctonia solani TaxID=456999 RepID=A0A8H3E6C5_9AGAM|nr:unnamed protein product [Rhizoctonia solani]
MGTRDPRTRARLPCPAIVAVPRPAVRYHRSPLLTSQTSRSLVAPELVTSPRTRVEIRRGPDSRVSLGDWLVLEPFVPPALYEPYRPGAIDEWTLWEAIEADNSRVVLPEFSRSFNWIPITIPYWAVKKFYNVAFWKAWPGNPPARRLNGRKYGLCINNTINVDLHTIPGSHSSFSHSGKRDRVNW